MLSIRVLHPAIDTVLRDVRLSKENAVPMQMRYKCLNL